MYKIETGIPIPAKMGRPPAPKALYPFADLQPGQSFFVKKTSTKLAKKCSRTLSVLSSQYAKRLQRRFTIRTLENGVRVWRVE